MSDLKPNPKLGWDFVFRQQPLAPDIRGKSLADLIVKITAYRARNKLPPGDPERELYDQLCSKAPQKCRSGNKQKGAKEKRPAKNPIALNWRILAWVTGLVERRKELVFVDEAEAERRSAICKDCPAQKDFESLCKGCAVNVREAIKGLLGGRPMEKLLGCKILSEDPRISTHLELPASENPTLPAHCWRKDAEKA